MKCRKSKIFDHLRKKQGFFPRKGQGLSLNTIVIAALVLVVLIVLWAIFTGRMGVFTKGLGEEDLKARAEAENIGKTTCEGTCFSTIGASGGKPALFKVKGVVTSTACGADQKEVRGAFTDVGTGQICCVNSGDAVTGNDVGC